MVECRLVFVQSHVGALSRNFRPPTNLLRGSRMGRGRQKAKHTKVARELKYYSPNTDLTQLERELAAKEDDQYVDKWADLVDDDDDDADIDQPRTA